MPGRGALVTFAVAAALIAVPALPHRADVRLASVDDADSPLGDGTALIFGTSGTPVASAGYQQAVEQFYLEPRGFDGTVQAPFTPEGLYPVTGVHTLPVDTSFAQEEQILDSAIQSQIAGGGVDAANPVVVFGWSQSADFSGLTMPELAAQGVPSDDVHFILVGDASNPDGGLLERFDLPVGTDPSVPSWASRSTAPRRPICSRPTSTPTNTTVSPTSPGTQSISCPTSTRSWASCSTTSPTSTPSPASLPTPYNFRRRSPTR